MRGYTAATDADFRFQRRCGAAHARSYSRIARRLGARDRRLALRSGDRLPVLARVRAEARMGSAPGDPGVQRSRRASACSRTTGCAAARCSAGFPRAWPASRSTSSRPAAPPACPRRASRSTTSAPTTSSSATRCPTSTSRKGSNWLMLGPSGPRRLRLSVEHLAQYRGGICFCVDLDPRWVIKLIKKGWSEHLEAYKAHVIDQAVTILQAGHDIRCMFTTPKLLEALALRLESMGTTIRQDGHHRHLLGRHRVHAAVEPLRARGTARRRLHDADLRQHADGSGRQRADRTGEQLQDHLLRAAAARGHRGRRLRRSEQASSTTAQSGRVKLTTLTKEFFVPGFLERDEGEREPPCDKYPVGRHQRRETVPRRRAVRRRSGCTDEPFNRGHKDTRQTSRPWFERSRYGPAERALCLRAVVTLCEARVR